MLQTVSDWLFTSPTLTPHGFCLLWEPWLIWSYLVGDGATGLAYFGIPIALVRFVRRRDDLVFKPVFWLFAAFILLCGTTHWLELLTIWVPAYRLEAVSKLATAAASVATTVTLWRLLPQALAFPSPAQMRAANAALLASEAQLRSVNALLEARVEERTAELAAKEARLRDLLATLDLGTFMTCDLDGTIRFWSEGCAHLYGWIAAEAVGQNAHELLRTVFPVSLAEVEAALERDGGWTGDLRHRARDGREVVVTARMVLRRDADGGAVAVLESLTDVTEARRVERERRRADALLRTIIGAAPGMIYAKDQQGRMVLANKAALDLLGKSWPEVKGRTALDYLDDRAQAEAVMSNDRRIMEQGQAEELEELSGMEGGQPRVMLSTKTPMRDPDGHVDGLVGVSVEITERKRTEQRLRLMVDELNHRVKNTLATVQSIAMQTLRGGDPAVRQVLEARLLALAAAHDVLTRMNWEGAELDDVVAGALAPHGGRDSGRFHVSGPPVRLQPRAALALAMGLHELATNALKYGAFSPGAADGWVDLRWAKSGDRIRLVWSEHGGPPVTLPSRRGFGTRLVERSLAQDLGGTVEIIYGPEGVTCVVEAPLAEVAAPAEVAAFPRVGGAAGH
jgi:PAS domain S-box-containing protein